MPPLARRVALARLGGATLALVLPGIAAAQPARGQLQSWKLAASRHTGIHDLAPAPDGGVWFTAQASGHLGWFDPRTGRNELLALGSGSSPHGVIQGPDQAAWITDGGQNAIVRVGWPGRDIQVHRLPKGSPYANLNTCAFDRDGDLWFTGQSGYIGKVVVKTGEVTLLPSPRGRGPYGICSTPAGDIWWCSLAGSFIARISDRKIGASQLVEPPTSDQGARRVWSDSRGRIWVSEWNSGNLSMHDPSASSWRSWKLPGEAPRPYAVYVDAQDTVWVAEWSGNAVYAFDPANEKFSAYPMPRASSNIRQILGRKGEIWLPESGTEHISVIRTV
ncbi:MAG: lyase [Betaproteobacteria bacterium]